MPTIDELWLPPSFNRDPKKHDRKHSGRFLKRVHQRSGFANRTLWDWVQFFGVLAIPVIVAAGTLYFTQQITFQQAQFTQQQAKSSLVASEQQHQTDIQIAQDQQKQATLDNYISSMQELLLNYKLRNSKPGDEVRSIADARTLSAIQQLGSDSDRKTSLILFLYQAHLITAPTSSSDQVNPVISLAGADLSNMYFPSKLTLTNLSEVQFISPFPKGEPDAVLSSICDTPSSTLAGSRLVGIDLSNTILKNANFYCIDLSNADFSGADLTGADLQSDLDNANLSNSTLSNADLFIATFIKSNLSSAIFCNSNYAFSLTNVPCANVSGADFRDADLIHSDFDQDTNSEDVFLQGATMPNGSIHP